MLTMRSPQNVDRGRQLLDDRIEQQAVDGSREDVGSKASSGNGDVDCRDSSGEETFETPTREEMTSRGEA